MQRNNAPTRRLILAFTSIIALFAVISGAAVYEIRNVSERLDRVVEDRNVKMGLVSEFLELARERSLILQSMLLTKDLFALDEQSMHMSKVVLRYIQLREQLLALPLSDKERALLEAQQKQTSETGAYQNHIADLMFEERYEDAHELLYRDAIPSQDKAMGLMESFIEYQRDLNRQEVSRAKTDIDRANTTIIAALIMGIVASAVVATWITVLLNREIARRNRIESELEERVAERTKELTYLASHDPLTSLANRSLLSSHIARAVEHARRRDRKVALFFIDLDGFKPINDMHGHDVGDAVLVEIGRRLQAVVRKEDIVGRIGGDEFTLLVADLENKAVALQIAEKVIGAAAQPILVDGVVCKVTLSMGIAFYPDDAHDADTLLTRADDFMYTAKGRGKNCYVSAESPVEGAIQISC